jgi:hypothetical protein
MSATIGRCQSGQVYVRAGRHDTTQATRSIVFFTELLLNAGRCGDSATMRRPVALPVMVNHQ